LLFLQPLQLALAHDAESQTCKAFVGPPKTKDASGNVESDADYEKRIAPLLKQYTDLGCNGGISSNGSAPATGNPGTTGGGVNGGTSSNGFVKVAEDIMAAYVKCEPPGLTFQQAGLTDCLGSTLKQLGYDDAHVQNFLTRQGNSLVGHSGDTGSGECTECLGYVGEVLALWGNTSDVNQTLNTLPTAVISQ